MGLPNLITILRILLVPVFVMSAYRGTDSGYVVALAVFAVASATDRIDGQIARARDSITRLGQFLDPTADKLLVGAALVVLVDLRSFPLWAALLIAVREIVVQVIRTRIVGAGGDLPASSGAKWKTALQLAMVCWWLLPWDRNPGHLILMAAAVAATIVSGAAYLRRRREPDTPQGAAG